MKWLIIPDIHQNWQKAEQVIESVPHDALIFLGDYFDSYNEPKTCASTAVWLEGRMKEDRPNEVYLLGNHDIQYIFPAVAEYTRCSGFTMAKFIQTVNLRNNPEVVNKFKLAYKIGKYTLSHAGFNFAFRNVNVDKYGLGYFPDAWVDELCKDGLEAAKNGTWNPILGAGVDRGGNQDNGGVLWQDWDSLDSIDHFSQIVGHSSGKEVRSKFSYDSNNICLDTNFHHVAILDSETNELEIKEV